MKKLKWNMILMSAIYVALGAVLLCWSEAVLNFICFAVGGIVILSGVLQIIRFLGLKGGAGSVIQAPLSLALGIVCLGLGLFLIVRGDIIMTALPIVFGLFIMFDGVLRVQNALELRRCEHKQWPFTLLLALLSVVLGLVMVFNPFKTANALVMAIGIILCVEGALNLISIVYTAAVVHHYVRLHPETVPAIEEMTGEDLNGDGVVGVPGSATVEGTAVETDAPAELPAPQQEPKPEEPFIP